jgi:hypothetical protein
MTSPKHRAQAVPGVYMLFVVNKRGVPSVGHASISNRSEPGLQFRTAREDTVKNQLKYAGARRVQLRVPGDCRGRMTHASNRSNIREDAVDMVNGESCAGAPSPHAPRLPGFDHAAPA